MGMEIGERMIQIHNAAPAREEGKMAEVQKYFEQFHDTIRIDFDASQPLRDKRDILLGRIRKHLSEHDRPSFDELLQGSYALKTGVIPIEQLEYDIDVGLRFAIRDTEYTAKEVRRWVFEAVDGHTEAVRQMGPCVRVGYADGYHVDLVAYATWTESGKEQFRLAHKTKGWRQADPPQLRQAIDTAMEPFAGTEDSLSSTHQFRRVVRYLRRWVDEAIPEESEAKPVGLAFVLLAARYLTPTRTWDGKCWDLQALQTVASAAGNTAGRIIIHKPSPEYEDVFAKLDEAAMDALKDRFRGLATDLAKANDEADPVDACRLIKAHLGRDFPVPTREETGKKTSAPAIVSSSSSAA